MITLCKVIDHYANRHRALFAVIRNGLAHRAPAEFDSADARMDLSPSFAEPGVGNRGYLVINSRHSKPQAPGPAAAGERAPRPASPAIFASLLVAKFGQNGQEIDQK